jgi:hypothetical protein
VSYGSANALSRHAEEPSSPTTPSGTASNKVPSLARFLDPQVVSSCLPHKSKKAPERISACTTETSALRSQFEADRVVGKGNQAVNRPQTLDYGRVPLQEPAHAGRRSIRQKRTHTDRVEELGPMTAVQPVETPCEHARNSNFTMTMTNRCGGLVCSWTFAFSREIGNGVGRRICPLVRVVPFPLD